MYINEQEGGGRVMIKKIIRAFLLIGVFCIGSMLYYKSIRINGQIPDVASLICEKADDITNIASEDIETHSLISELSEHRGYSIYEAVLKGDVAFIEEYLLCGGKIDVTDSHQKTMLHYAVEYAQIDIVNFLLSKGANPYGFSYYLFPNDDYDKTPIYAAYELRKKSDVLPEVFTAIINIIENAADSVDTDSKKVVEYIENNNVYGIKNILALGRALHNDAAERINWYALENNDLSLFRLAATHPSLPLLFTAEAFWAELVKNKTEKRVWINIIRDNFNRGFYTNIKYNCMQFGCDEVALAPQLLLIGCAQGNLDLVRLSLALGADPTIEITEDGKMLFDYIGSDWSQIGVSFNLALPDWPTVNDEKIKQLLRIHINSSVSVKKVHKN